ncbi:porin [Methylobacterium sp. C25]|uniref:porin n=1 Tax=Methylobacterium sp. C25 TaxID=2721622 RepID=UPI001F330704|nr:porin [Methylobacterium sp. C25]MCE4224643.1 porin [Methylobacterium sp. C25]
MKLIKSLLLGSAAGLTAVAGAQAADLPVKKAAPIEYVRVCGAYGAGFFYIPGTDTCLRVSGRARGEAGINTSPNRRTSGDTSQFRGLLRINIDARTQTDYGTLRAFARLEAASATGEGKMASGTQARIGNGYFGTGQDSFNRVQDYVQAEKAFIQFAGLTAGRASSFFDFYAHDFEIIGSSLGSDQASTNLFAYTKTFGEGFSATLSMEDPNFRKNPIFSNGGSLPSNSAVTSAIGQTFFGIGTNAPTPVILNFGPTGAVANVGYVDVVQRSRMPDFVGALRYDQPWGSLQISGAVKDINTGGFTSTITTAPGQAAITTAGAAAALAARGITSGTQTDYGWAIQGGAKFNLPFISPGDSLYLQGAYGEGAANYTGYTSYIGRYTQATGIVSGGPWNVYMNDAVINPVTGRLELSSSWTVVASYLHYWTPQWRSAVYGSYGEMHQPAGATAALRGLAGGGTGITGLPSANPAALTATSTLVNTSQVVTGASLIWSPVKDLDIGAEGQYIRVDTLNGQRVLNTDTGRLVSGQDTFQARVRVQRDF